jgi:dynein heavy chain
MALASLKEIQDVMQRLVDQFDAAKAKEKALTDQYEDSERKCTRAVSLIEKLADEEVAWARYLKQNRANKLNLVGDVIISAGVIAYMGVFSEAYRLEAVSNWVNLMKSFDIKSSPEYSLREVLGNEVKIQQWQIDQLP